MTPLEDITGAGTGAGAGRWRLIVPVWCAVLALAIGGWVGLSDDEPVDAAACDELEIEVLGLRRCVVPGGQSELDGGHVVRFGVLSNTNVHWIAGHRTSHGATFNALTNLRIGDEVEYRGARFVIEEYQLVDRHAPAAVISWMSSSEPRVVLQTSATSPFVHVWRAEPAPASRPSDPDAPRPVRIHDSAAVPMHAMTTPFAAIDG